MLSDCSRHTTAQIVLLICNILHNVIRFCRSGTHFSLKRCNQSFECNGLNNCWNFCETVSTLRTNKKMFILWTVEKCGLAFLYGLNLTTFISWCRAILNRSFGLYVLCMCVFNEEAVERTNHLSGFVILFQTKKRWTFPFLP